MHEGGLNFNLKSSEVFYMSVINHIQYLCISESGDSLMNIFYSKTFHEKKYTGNKKTIPHHFIIKLTLKGLNVLFCCNLRGVNPMRYDGIYL